MHCNYWDVIYSLPYLIESMNFKIGTVAGITEHLLRKAVKK